MAELITCPMCDGWSPSETGMTCDMCGGDGAVWDDEPADEHEAVSTDGPAVTQAWETFVAAEAELKRKHGK